jgi:hypothetical protein
MPYLAAYNAERQGRKIMAPQENRILLSCTHRWMSTVFSHPRMSLGDRYRIYGSRFWLNLDLCAAVAGPTNGRLDRASGGDGFVLVFLS